MSQHKLNIHSQIKYPKHFDAMFLRFLHLQHSPPLFLLMTTIFVPVFSSPTMHVNETPSISEMDIFMLDKFFTKFLIAINEQCCKQNPFAVKLLPESSDAVAAAAISDKAAGGQLVKKIDACLGSGCADGMDGLLKEFEKNFIENDDFHQNNWKKGNRSEKAALVLVAFIPFFKKWLKTVKALNKVKEGFAAKLLVDAPSAMLAQMIGIFKAEVKLQQSKLAATKSGEKNSLEYELADRLRWAEKNLGLHDAIAGSCQLLAEPMKEHAKEAAMRAEIGLLNGMPSHIAINLQAANIVTMGNATIGFMKEVVNDRELCQNLLQSHWEEFGYKMRNSVLIERMTAELYTICVPELANNKQRLHKLLEAFERHLMSSEMHSEFPMGWLWMRELITDVSTNYSDVQRAQYLFHGLSNLVPAFFSKYKSHLVSTQDVALVDGVTQWLRLISDHFHKMNNPDMNGASFEYVTLVSKCPKLENPNAQVEDGTYGPWEFF